LYRAVDDGSKGGITRSKRIIGIDDRVSRSGVGVTRKGRKIAAAGKHARNGRRRSFAQHYNIL